MTNRIAAVATIIFLLGGKGLQAGVISAGPPIAQRLSDTSAPVGSALVIEGSNLGGDDLVVRFGAAPAVAANPGRSRQAIRVEVPDKQDPRDPDTVIVTVFVNGVEAAYPGGPLEFTYEIP